MEYVLKLLLSFLVGGAYVSGVVWLSEKQGSRIGAAIAGLPSTILIGLAFITALEGASSAQAALTLVPLMFAATLTYALIFVFALKNKFSTLASIVLGALGWLGLVFIIKRASTLDFAVIGAISIFILLAFSFLLRNLGQSKPVKVTFPPSIHFIRFFVGGLVIAGSILAARLLDPLWGGIIASFPGMLGVILYFIHKSQGREFVEGFIKSLPISYFGSLTFIIVTHSTITRISAVVSFALGILGALICMALILTFKNARLAR